MLSDDFIKTLTKELRKQVLAELGLGLIEADQDDLEAGTEAVIERVIRRASGS